MIFFASEILISRTTAFFSVEASAFFSSMHGSGSDAICSRINLWWAFSA
jgi:hypothetical protein